MKSSLAERATSASLAARRTRVRRGGVALGEVGPERGDDGVAHGERGAQLGVLGLAGGEFGGEAVESPVAGRALAVAAVVDAMDSAGAVAD